jgi:hypothetical protein
MPSLNDRQKPAGKVDWPIHGVQKDTQDDYHGSSEHINPILSMKSGIAGLHFVALSPAN